MTAETNTRTLEGILASDTANSKHILIPSQINRKPFALKHYLLQFFYPVHHVWLSIKRYKAYAKNTNPYSEET